MNKLIFNGINKNDKRITKALKQIKANGELYNENAKQNIITCEMSKPFDAICEILKPIRNLIEIELRLQDNETQIIVTPSIWLDKRI